MAVLYGPADEVAALVAVGEGGIGHPTFQVGLRAGAQGDSVGGEPGEEVVSRGDVAANVEVLKLSGVLVADAAAESAQVVPDRVAVQDPAFDGVCVGLDRQGDPFLQGDEPFFARRQGARGDEDAAKVSQHLPLREFVEVVVGDGTFIVADAFQQVLGRGSEDPGQGDIGTLGTGQCLMEGRKFGSDSPCAVAEEVADLLVQEASLAGARAELPRGRAGRAASPEIGVGVGALRAQRVLPGAAAGLGDGAAAAAGHPSLLAAFAPGLPGGPGDFARGGAAAVSALSDLFRPAVIAAGAVDEPDRDGLTASAADADFQVDRGADQAVGTQRLTGGVPGGGFTDGAAACAGDGRVPGEAGSADPLAVQEFRQRLHSVAARAGRLDDCGGAGGDEFADESQHCRSGGLVPGAGQQLGTVDHGPGE